MEYFQHTNLDIEGMHILLDNDFLSFALYEESFLDKLMELVDKENVLVVDYFC